MSWLTNTALTGLKAGCGLLLAAALLAWGQESGEFRVPESTVAGSAFTVSTSGSGKAALYVVGPGTAFKQSVRLGQSIQVQPDKLTRAGQYLVVLCAETCQTKRIYVIPADPASMVFLTHPSRVPAGKPDAISGVALPLDKFKNQILTPVAVDFRVTSNNVSLMSTSIKTQGGVSWFRTASSKKAGPVDLVASVGNIAAHRAVRLVASEPCNLRIKAQRTNHGIIVETELVRDCAGNPVPDGTIVTFTGKGSGSTTTVDAPIKQGIARAQMLNQGSAVISVASGVVMGNELHVEAP